MQSGRTRHMSDHLLYEIEQRLGRQLTPEERHLLELARDGFERDSRQNQNRPLRIGHTLQQAN